MKTFSVRCSNSDFAYAVLEGDKDTPIVVSSGQIAFPKNFSEGEKLQWLHQELSGLLQNHSPEKVVVKAPEPLVKRSNAIDSRLHNESIVLLAAQTNGIKESEKKTNATIAKDLGLKGRAKYLKTGLDTDKVEGFSSYSAKIQEAILASWSSL